MYIWSICQRINKNKKVDKCQSRGCQTDSRSGRMTHSGAEEERGGQPRWRVKQESRWTTNANASRLKSLLCVRRIHLALISVAESSRVAFPLTLNVPSRIAQRISQLKADSWPPLADTLSLGETLVPWVTS